MSVRSFSAAVSSALAAVQASCSALTNVGVGTPIRALMEAAAATGLWLQYIALQILATTRLSSCSGTDVDSFVGDFGMARLPGTAASGSVLFTSFNATGQSATILVGATVKTASSLVFAVVSDTGNPYWSSAQGGYIRPAGVASVSVPVQCLAVGSVGNVASGAIGLLGTSVSGVDTVTNVAAFTNGTDGETDAALKARFPVWMASKASGTSRAVDSAIAGVQTNLTSALMDGLAPDQAARSGYFTAVVDDGSGDPSDDVLASVQKNIDVVRSLGVGFSVQRPVLLLVNVSMTVTIAAGGSPGTVQAAVQAALTKSINGTSVGQGYAYSLLPVVAYSSAGVTILSVTDVLMNGAQDDIPASTVQVTRAGSVVVTVQEAG
nr:baseplate J/gp47 family protein [Ameyamaea chiangmaiensis]